MPGTRSQTAQEVANQRANAVIDPQLRAIAEAQAAADAAARAAWERQQTAIRGYSQAAAQMLQPVAGQVQQGYADASQRTANYAKGFSIGFNAAVTGNSDQANALLAQNGSPQHVASQGAPVPT
jgi:molybdate-binding protein